MTSREAVAVRSGGGVPGGASALRAVLHAHYAGNLVDGAYVMALFGDVATELMIHTDRDEGLFASYSDVQFRSACAGATSSR